MLEYINKNKHIIILIVLILFSALAQLYQIDRDFNGLHEYDAAQYSLFCRNSLEYGLLKTKLAPVCNINPLDNNYIYYLYHPFLTVYLYALFFKIFGLSIISGRLISILFFSFGAALLYFLISKIQTKESALWSIFFYLSFPLSQYFGKFVAKETIIMPLIFLLLMAYYFWLKKKQNKYFYLMLAALFLGLNTDWLAYYLVPAVIIHFRYLLNNKDQRIFVLLYLALASFIIYITFNFFLTGSLMGTQSQWQALNQPQVAGTLEHGLTARMRYELFWQPRFYYLLAEQLLFSFGLPALLLILIFLFKYDKIKILKSPNIYLLGFPFIYFCHLLLFPKSISDHVQMNAYLSPALAFACALAIRKLSQTAKILLLALFLTFAALGTYNFYTMNNTNQVNLALGKIISEVTNEKESVALSQPFFSPFIEYFGKRKTLYDVTSWQRLNYVIRSNKINHFITNFKVFKDYLTKKYPAKPLPYGFMIFKLKQI